MDNGSIDLQSRLCSEGLYARKLWEWLFRNTEISKAPSYDSFLCDLKLFEEYVPCGKFWWQHTSNGWTDISGYNLGKGSYRIEVFMGKEIKITKEV